MMAKKTQEAARAVGPLFDKSSSVINPKASLYLSAYILGACVCWFSHRYFGPTLNGLMVVPND